MNDSDFEQFIKLLDAALVSDDKKIKTALRKFMFIMALNLSDDDCEPGPFTKMMETIDELQRRVGGLEMKDNSTWTTTDPYTQTWPYGVGIGTAGPPYQTPPSTTGGSITATGTTNWTNAPSASTGTVTTTTTANTPFSAATNCWTNIGTTYTINLGDEDSGTEIKNEIKDKLEKLVNTK